MIYQSTVHKSADTTERYKLNICIYTVPATQLWLHHSSEQDGYVKMIVYCACVMMNIYTAASVGWHAAWAQWTAYLSTNEQVSLRRVHPRVNPPGTANDLFQGVWITDFI